MEKKKLINSREKEGAFAIFSDLKPADGNDTGFFFGAFILYRSTMADSPRTVNSEESIVNLVSFSDSRRALHAIVSDALKTPPRTKERRRSYMMSKATTESHELSSAVKSLNALLDAHCGPSESEEIVESGNVEDDNTDGNKNERVLILSPSGQSLPGEIQNRIREFSDPPEIELQSNSDSEESNNGAMRKIKFFNMKAELEESRAAIVRHVHSAAKLRKEIQQTRRQHDQELRKLKVEFTKKKTPSPESSKKKESSAEALLLRDRHERTVATLNKEIDLLRDQLREGHDDDLEKIKQEEEAVEFMSNVVLQFLKQK